MAVGTDLRACSWCLVSEIPQEGGTLSVTHGSDGPAQMVAPPDCPILIDGNQLAGSRLPWLDGNEREAVRLRQWMMVVGVDDARERARLLRLGFGDVVGHDAQLDEVEARAERLSEMANTLHRFRTHGPLRLDLLLREGFVHGKVLGLHPREFALLWRLMETPGEQVEKTELLREVWRLSFVPETNSIAVHVSRLRGKLAQGGLEGWVLTGQAGGYYLVADPDQTPHFDRSAERAGAQAGRSKPLMMMK